ncbi:hypothetical protein ACVWYN_000037 [Pedobacter sp. UYP24]
MASYKNGINGAFIGKVGNVVGVESRGKYYMRSIPDFSNHEPSDKQFRQRRLLSLMSTWLKPLKSLIKIGFQLLSPGKTAMNEAFALNYKEALTVVDGKGVINYDKAVFSRGELLVSLVLEFLTLLDSILHIKWDNALASSFNKENDQATFVVYNPAKEKFVTFNNVANRADKEVALQLPSNFTNDTVHCWMFYANEQGDKVSTSAYIGEVIVA